MHFKIYLISQISFSIFFKICLILCRKYASYLNYSYKNEYVVKALSPTMEDFSKCVGVI